MANIISRGPKWLQTPFYSLDDKTPWWPNRSLLREEALATRDCNDHRFLLPVANTGRETSVTLDFQYAGDHTPVLCQYRDAFLDRYGDFGLIHTHYFFIDKDADYEWHKDNVLPTASTDQGKALGVNCCLNVIVTDDGSECEFLDAGIYKYTAGVLNTSHLHRVKPSHLRILARISFFDAVYEEVVYKIRKTDKILNKQ